MKQQKNALLIQSLAGYGKCSATIGLPVLSAAGHSAALLPTAVLSTHTGGLGEPTKADLTGQIEPVSQHWAALGLNFDAIYTGYIPSLAQFTSIKQAIKLLKKPHTRLLVDPAMADNGTLYRGCSPALTGGMRELCKEADWITPNITEAFLLLNQPYQEGPYPVPFLQDLLRNLAALGAKNVILTGVIEGAQIGTYSYCSACEKIYKATFPLVNGRFHGTGDLFSSTLLAALLAEKELEDAVNLAAEVAYRAVYNTSRSGRDPRHGLRFEPDLPFLWSWLAPDRS